VGGALAQLFGDRSGYLFSDDGGETPVGGLGKNVTFKRDMGHGAASQDAVAKVGEERGLNWPQEYWCLHDLRCIDAFGLGLIEVPAAGEAAHESLRQRGGCGRRPSPS
jgi:hypothetical protein